jgi:type IV pilus assembly protein PilA
MIHPNLAVNCGSFYFCSSYQVIGLILISLALPLFLGQGNPVIRQLEAEQYVGLMNRTQQSKYYENGSFVNSIEALGIGIKTETTNYRYSIDATKNTAFNYGVAKDQKLKSSVGGVFFVKFDKVTQVTTTVSILCQEKKAGTSKPNYPLLKNDQAVCGEGTEEERERVCIKIPPENQFLSSLPKSIKRD